MKLRDDEIDAVFAMFDSDGSGEIDYGEFMAALDGGSPRHSKKQPGSGSGFRSSSASASGPGSGSVSRSRLTAGRGAAREEGGEGDADSRGSNNWMQLKIGSTVEARALHGARDWALGKVLRVRRDNSFDVRFEDGTIEHRVPIHLVRRTNRTHARRGAALTWLFDIMSLRCRLLHLHADGDELGLDLLPVPPRVLLLLSWGQ